jgi:hypothetical protein
MPPRSHENGKQSEDSSDHKDPAAAKVAAGSFPGRVAPHRNYSLTVFMKYGNQEIRF